MNFIFGLENDRVPKVRNLLGLVLTEQAQFEDGEAGLRRAHDMAVRNLSDRHELTSTAATSLADNLQEQGRFAPAEPLFRVAPASRRWSWGGVPTGPT